ncbi:HAD-IIIC family phosphatase [bacterium]|nr:HAD-IIIC family phosphatase [bacterium]
MRTLEEICLPGYDKSLAEYIALNRKIESALNDKELVVNKTIRLAILASSTIRGIEEVLRVQCAEIGIYADIYLGEYNQYAQEIFNSGSQLYQFNPDLIIVFADTRAITGEYFFMPYKGLADDRKIWMAETSAFFRNLVNELTKQTSAKVILHNFEIPTYSPLGILESKDDYGFVESIEDINRGLRNDLKNNNQVFLFDFNTFCSKVGKKEVFDDKMYYLGDIKIKLQYIPSLCQEYLKYIRPLASLIKKCIVLDLDNTLWGGIIGENGVDGIKLGPTPEGRPFWEFQQLLLSLYNRGVLLAVNSKNNFDDAIEVIRNHKYMVLREEYFAAIRINWNDKASNIQSIAEEINIGIDSLVFFDDDSVNREMVRTFHPEVMVVDLPSDPALYVETLINLNCFEMLSLTKEDKKKGMMYLAEKKRRQLVHTATNLTEYLRQLETVVVIEDVNKGTIPRIAQMTQKTNQFNMTTFRYTDEKIKEFVEDDNYLVISLSLTDKFGDSGITGLSIVERKNRDHWWIDTFLLSCRIIGRKAEDALLAYIVKKAQVSGASLLSGAFIPSEKNMPAKEFYNNCGMKKMGNKDEMEIWEFDLKKDFPFPDFISIRESGDQISSN